jgi:phosphoribosylglycinamide formyltransferase-1
MARAPCRVVVFASGRGSNFAALAAAAQSGALPIQLCALLSDRPRAPVLTRARQAGVPTELLVPRDYSDRAAFDRAMFARAASYQPDWIVLAGYLRVIDAAVIETWRGRVVNIHPSLLPKYPGLDTHRRVLAAGDREHGATVHFVTAELDGGPVIANVRIPIEPGDTPESLAARLLPHEHRLLCATVALLATGRLRLGAKGVELDGQVLPAPLYLGADDRLHRSHTVVG